MIRLEFEPFPELTTARLTLQQIGKHHIEDIFELLSNERVAEYDYFYPVATCEDAMKFIERYEYELNDRTEITWGIFLKVANCIESMDVVTREGICMV